MELTVENATVSLGAGTQRRRILDDVSFRVPSGTFTSLLGASGAGKSTLLKVVAGVLVQDAGTVRFDGVPVDTLPPHKRGLGFVFQDMRLFPNMTVEENVAFPCKMRGMGRKARLARARELLERVQLGGFGGREVRSLSGGQAQRVALARALSASPRALLLDEPFSGLDESLRDDMRSLMLHLHREEGVTTVMVTHDAEEALMMSDSIVYVSGGRVLQQGAPDDLYEHPAAEEVAACFGDCSRLAGKVREGTFRAGGLALLAGGCAEGPAHAVVRHAGIHVQAAYPGKTAAGAGAREAGRDRMRTEGRGPSALFAGTLPVRCCVYCGGQNLLRADVDGQTLAAPTRASFSEGDQVDVFVDPRACFVYGGGGTERALR